MKLERLHRVAMTGITSAEELAVEVEKICEKVSRKPYRQRMYLLWYYNELTKPKPEPKEPAKESPFMSKKQSEFWQKMGH